MRLLQAASQHLRLPQGEATERLKDTLSVAVACSIACVSNGTASATRPARVYAAPKAAATRGKKREVRVLTDAHGPFEQGECPGEVALAEGQQTDPVIGIHEAPGVSNLLGNPEPFFPEGGPANVPSSAWHQAR